ncbi:MAG: hypothetical protein E2P03_11785 [Acidobacteria bacterium]|nr:MAG: hypothetical protein E2P03_11785 [Acidobacteriota bacterium]
MSSDLISNLQGLPSYHVRTRESLMGEIADTRHPAGNAPMTGNRLLAEALQKMDSEGWKLVAAAGDALLFRARRQF